MYINSTIKRTPIVKKKCKCDACQSDQQNAKWPTLSCQGYYYSHVPEELKEVVGTRKKVYGRIKTNKNTLSRKIHKFQDDIQQTDLLKLWYVSKKHVMTNRCEEPGCQNSTNKWNNYYYWSVCHIVPKKLCPSTAIEPENWIELCQYHHSEFDSTFEKAAKMGCFAEAKRKFQLFKHLIPNTELRKVNPHLLEENYLVVDMKEDLPFKKK